MERTTENIITSLKEIFNFDIVRRLFFLAGIALSVVIGFSIYQWIQEPIYRPLDYAINNENFPLIIDTLEKSGVKYKINEANGSISVPASDINQINIKLSAAGISKDDGFSFSFLNDKSKLGTSVFLENARYLLALEADLAKTIRSIQGISAAKVTIAKPPNDIFADEHSVTTASIVVNISPGYEGDKEKVRAIIQLVAASVPGLDPTNIAITDQYGHYISSMSGEDYTANQDNLSYQKSLENSYERRIASLINPILGMNRASIDVNIELDFTHQEVAKEDYVPNQNNIRSEQTVSESSGGGGASGVPGALSNQPSGGGGNTASSSGSGGSGGRSEQTRNFELSKSTRYIKTNSPKILKISVAILLDDEVTVDPTTKKVISKPQSKAKIDKITELVKASIGYNKKRGDVVAVVNTGFVPNNIVNEGKGLSIIDQPWFWDLVKKILGISFGSILLFVLYRKISPEMFKKKADEAVVTGTDMSNAVSPEMLKLKNEQIAILKELVTTEPNKVTGIIKKWVAK
jgi:flagellar M-ring protein FliF